MDIKTTKLELMQMLLKTEKESILKKLQEVFEKETDWWNELSKKEQQKIEASIKSLDEGKVISNNQVQERIAKYVKSKTNS